MQTLRTQVSRQWVRTLYDHTRSGEQTSISSDIGRFWRQYTALACLLLLVANFARGAEYQRNEQGTPASATEIGSLLDALHHDREILPQVLRDSTVDLKLRTYHFEQDLLPGQVARATTYGGHLGLTTGSLKGWQAGLTWYGTYEISSNVNGAETQLLAENKDDISVLGKAFVRYSKDEWQLDLFRQEINLPYINKLDSRMIPNTFEAYSVSRDGIKIDLFASHVTDMKTRSDDEFRSMAQVAGADRDRGASVVGARYAFREGVDVGAMILNSWDLFRTIYAEANWFYELPFEAQYKASVQYTEQRSNGDELLGDFDTWTAGVRGVLSYKNLIATVSFTQTADGAGIQSPYGGRPSYNSLMLSDFDRAGEKSLHAALSYEFTRIGVEGLGVSMHYAKGWDAARRVSSNIADRNEWDVTFEYKPDGGFFRGFWLRLRYATVEQADGLMDRDQFRAILNYEVPVS